LTGIWCNHFGKPS